MKIKKVIQFSALFLTIAINSLVAQEKPNIVLIYIDDWAWNGSPVAMYPDMPNSRMPVVEMPNIERIASEGMIFQNAYGSPQCSPARACILTGQTSARNGFTVYMNPKGDTYYDTNEEYEGFKVLSCIANKSVDPATTFGIPKALTPLGYSCAHLGKWHMRSDPGEHGYILNDGDTDNNPGNTLKANLEEGEEKPKRLTEELMKDPKLMFSITEKAIGFMEAQVEKGNPFYIQISHYAMHEGRECKVETREKYVNNPYVQAYYKAIGKTAEDVHIKEDPAVWLGMADDLDGRIGAVLDKIEELGIKDNTYVIMVADNGYREEFLPGLTQPLHARKWWVWEGGIRVPMIAMGPGIKPGSTFTGNVVNYDFLPTFVDWAGGDVNELKDIDGVSLAPYMEGKKPDKDFLNRNLYFHYPHYRSSMPHTAMISGSYKILHFWGYPDIPLLFDLSKDIGEVNNIASENKKLYNKLYAEMMNYLEEVDARIPKLNPDYDPKKYQADQDYWYRVNWGPFSGKRNLDDDERKPMVSLANESSNNPVNDMPEIKFVNLKDGANLPEGSELRVEVEVKDKDGVERTRLYLNGLLINSQGMTSAPTVWTSGGDPMLKSLKPGKYQLKLKVEDIVGNKNQKEIEFTIGNKKQYSSAVVEEVVYRVILNEGESIKSDEKVPFRRLECRLKLEGDGNLKLIDDEEGAIFESGTQGPQAEYFLVLENGQLRIYEGKPNNKGELIWETNKPSVSQSFQLGITNSKKLVIYYKNKKGKLVNVWKSI